MTLARRHLLASLILALPAAIILLITVNRLQARDAATALERVAQAHLVDVMRDACLQDPQWFLAGPNRSARPRLDERNIPDADVRLPRPSAEELPFEIFAYDDQYSPSSSAGPRFPDAFKRAMRSPQRAKVMTGEYSSGAGAGLQTAVVTGWGGQCSVLLFRQQPIGTVAGRQALVFGGFYLACFLVAMLVASPTAARIRNLSLATLKSARNEYADIVPVKGSDEIGSMAALFNDTAADIRRKSVDARDREETLRRHVENSTAEVGEPLLELEKRIGRMLAARPDSDTAAVVKETHRIAATVQNQSAVIRLRGVTDATTRVPVDVTAMIARLVDDCRTLAGISGVTIDASKAGAPLTIQADEVLIERAIANVLDNAIIYNKPGGTVRIELHAYDHGSRFKLLFADTGPGVSDEEFAGLTANKRFRGDESRTRRPGGRGLGLALAREVADRFGLQLDIRRPFEGGMEVEFSTR